MSFPTFSSEDRQAAVEDLIKSIAKVGVGAKERQELLVAPSGMKKDIVVQ